MKQKNNFDFYISAISLLVAILSAIFASISNTKAEKAILLAEEANKISAESNLISQEANRLASESNLLMESANQIQLLNTSKNVSVVSGPSLVAPKVWHCGYPNNEGVIITFDFGVDLRNSSERDISLTDMSVDVVGVDEIKKWELNHYNGCGKRELIPVMIPSKKEENWYFISFAEQIIDNDSSLENLLGNLLFHDSFSSTQQKNIRINLSFDDDSQIVWEAPIAYIMESHQFDYWSEMSCSELSKKVVITEAGMSSYDPESNCP